MRTEEVSAADVQVGDVVEVSYGYVEVATKPELRTDGRWYFLTVADLHGKQYEIGQMLPMTRRIDAAR